MFYNNNQMNEQLRCLICEKKLIQPKTLPCGYSICNICETDILRTTTRQYKCTKCELIHDIPNDGLPKNMMVLSLLDMKPVKITMLNQNLCEQLDKIEILINEIQKKCNSFHNKIESHCENAKYEIDVTTESFIIELQKSRDELLSQIDKFKEKSKTGWEKFFIENQLDNVIISAKKEVKKISSCMPIDENLNSNKLEELMETSKNVERELLSRKKLIDSYLYDNMIYFLDNNIKLSDLNLGCLGSNKMSSNYLIDYLNHIGRNKIDYHTQYSETQSCLADINQNGQIVLLIRSLYLLGDKGARERHECQLRYYYDQTANGNKYRSFKIEDNKYLDLAFSENIIYTTCYCSDVNAYKISMYDTEIQLKKCEYFNFNPIKIIINTNQLFIVSSTAPFIHVMNENLEEISAIGQNKYQDKVYYADTNKIIIKNEYIFITNGKKVRILFENTGKLFKILNFEHNIDLIEVFHKSSMIAIFDKTTKIIKVYDIDGNLCDEILIENIENVYSLRITDTGYFAINDLKNNSLFTN